MAQAVQKHTRHPSADAIYIRADIRNAFNEISRQAAIDALRNAHPTLAGLHHTKHPTLKKKGARPKVAISLGSGMPTLIFAVLVPISRLVFCFRSSFVATMFGDHFWRSLSLTFGDHFWRSLLAIIFGDHFWWSVLFIFVVACATNIIPC